MNPSKVVRVNIRKLTDLPNIGKAGAADLELLGIKKPHFSQQPLSLCFGRYVLQLI